ncbi:MAG: hypothetical protein GY953_35180, partial [bacterium]|nr:hypothetical protein [bacterium]
MGVRVSADGAKRLVFNRNGEEQLGATIEGDTLYFRTDIDGATATVSYSLDGKSWREFGGRFPLIFGRWRGDRLGFYSWNDQSAAGHLDVDWFRYEYDG